MQVGALLRGRSAEIAFSEEFSCDLFDMDSGPESACAVRALWAGGLPLMRHLMTPEGECAVLYIDVVALN